MSETPTIDSPDRSPDILAGAPTRGQGVRRLNRVPLFIVLGIVVVVMLVLLYTMIQRSHHQAGGGGEADNTPVTTNPAVLNGMPASGSIAATSPTINPNAPPGTPGSGSNGTGANGQAPVSPYAAQWDAYRAQQAQVDSARLQAAQDAMSDGPDVQVAHNASASPSPSAGVPGAIMPGGGTQLAMAGGGGGPSLGQPNLISPNPAAAALLPGAGFGGGLAAAGYGGFGGLGGGQQSVDPNGQAAKKAFLDSPGSIGNDYLASGRNAPISPFEMKAGTVIPGVMIGGINSDLPGQIIGQVRENVYDTATGKHLLIPQGSRLIGTYSNAVTLGQTRVLVAWTRIIYPDASSLDLGTMPGADQGGYAGMSDQVNNHYLRIFGTALMMSLFSAGIQLSQPQATNGQNYSSQQIVASSLGLQLGQLGMQLAQRGLDIQPTLEIRPGYRFNIMVTKDVVIRPWKQ